ncbi:MAG: hypothetical protein KatS3mg087_1618 [Patescibacteria group bacterium]|nr:MAG: hypothetical protein KatS3mg087_1618 [Patescibacteria group bacterium]
MEWQTLFNVQSVWIGLILTIFWLNNMNTLALIHEIINHLVEIRKKLKQINDLNQEIDALIEEMGQTLSQAMTETKGG